MGLDSRLSLVYAVPDEVIDFYTGMNITTNPMVDILYVEEDEVDNDRYANIRHLMKPINVLMDEIDWDAIMKDCGVPIDSHICGLGPGYISIGEASNLEHETFNIDWYDPKYKIVTPKKIYVWHSSTVYEWSRTVGQQKIRKLFDKTFPEVWDKYDESYEMGYDKYYYLTSELLKQMKELDPDFAYNYSHGYKNVVYSADW